MTVKGMKHCWVLLKCKRSVK